MHPPPTRPIELYRHPLSGHSHRVELFLHLLGHNYIRDGAFDSDHYDRYTSLAPLFLKGEGERARLRQFIRQHIHRGDGLRVIDEIEASPIRPSKKLADSVARLLKGNREFVLIDDQKTIFEAAKAAAMRATPERPHVVIIEGGPGTGKSVVAINLLSDLLVAGRVGKYVSKNAAPRKVYEAKLARQMTATRFRSLFAGSGGFVDAPKVSNDFLVVDEAHRLNEKSGLYGNLGDHQVKGIMTSSNYSIFFVDEDSASRTPYGSTSCSASDRRAIQRCPATRSTSRPSTARTRCTRRSKRRAPPTWAGRGRLLLFVTPRRIVSESTIASRINAERATVGDGGAA